MTVKNVAVVGLVLAMLMVVSPAMAENMSASRVTFTKDVMPILQAKCQACHRAGGVNMSGMIAPMSLVTFKEVRPWAKALARVVESREMPPWHASDAQDGHFRNERKLSKEQIDTIITWVKQGATRGNPNDAPEPIEWKEGWIMGEPDLVLAFPEPFFVEDDVEDLYKNITVQITKEQLPEDAWVQRVEFQPGSEVVHHIIAYATDPEAGASRIDENADVEGDEEFLRGRTMIAGLAPGTDPGYFPEGFGIPLKAGSEMTFAMHYHKESGPGTGVADLSIMAIKFSEGRPEREVHIANIAHGAFEIPPNAKRWVVSGAETMEQDSLLINLMPHSHLRGVGASYKLVYPDGTSEELLNVPKYDFNWQTWYSFAEPKFLPAGSRIEYETIYDNSPENAERVGFNSNRAVRFGGPTTDEMDLGWYTFAEAKATGIQESGD